MTRDRSPKPLFQDILCRLFRAGSPACIFNPDPHLDPGRQDDSAVAASLHAAFLTALCGSVHPGYLRALACLNERAEKPEWAECVAFFRSAIEHIDEELETAASTNPEFMTDLQKLAFWLSSIPDDTDSQALAEQLWQVFCPEASGITGFESERASLLRAKRIVKIDKLNPNPLEDPWQQLLMTANVLLTVPSASETADATELSPDLLRRARRVRDEPQIHWYDHPIPLGAAAARNEVVYGLQGMDEACDFERRRSTPPPGARMPCVLSVSVTHRGLQPLARPYIAEALKRSGGLRHIDPYVLTESDCDELRDQVLTAAAEHFLKAHEARARLEAFGVDGEYGRHYSLLKAIAAFWQVLIQPAIRATFKIDLDQIFPQPQLVEYTGTSAFEHFRTPLWGASGHDADGFPVELGMIAGSLVNQGDIERSLFTPDVPFPSRSPREDEFVFYSVLPQALSTEAEMMTRYGEKALDGTRACIQRVHVTGGTTGILVDSLRRHRPFTPSFIGRAEDQAYLMSVWRNRGIRLSYVHAPGLIMRHDKQSFAQEAIRAAHAGKLIGDYIRLLYFSAYARSLDPSLAGIKRAMDPFTGCFISRIPVTVALLRFVLKTVNILHRKDTAFGLEFHRLGVSRLHKSLAFMRKPSGFLESTLEQERCGWTMYYEVLDALESALRMKDPFARRLQARAAAIIGRCLIRL